MKRVLVVAMAVGTLVGSGCIASHKYVKNQVKTSTDQLSTEVNGRIDTTNGRVDTLDGNLKETRDSVDLVGRRVSAVDERVATVDSRVTEVDGRVANVDGKVNTVDQRVATLDTRTNQQVGGLKQDVAAVDVKADQTIKNLDVLDEKFASRNNLKVSSEHSIQFGFDSFKLDKSGMSQLDEIAAAVGDNRDAVLVLEGHTDSTGDRDYNIALGERRVEQVKRYLAVDKSIPVYRIHEISFGAARPVASNDSLEGRKLNRSVTITVLVPAASADAASTQIGQAQ
ncbi:MAG TPA: OmpA family protein [Terriglobia bacterium]|nr:OmpA family protein [Terriglobia bacterium]